MRHDGLVFINIAEFRVPHLGRVLVQRAGHQVLFLIIGAFNFNLVVAPLATVDITAVGGAAVAKRAQYTAAGGAVPAAGPQGAALTVC